MTSSRRQTQGDLETVIDQPLERGQRSNHSDPDWQTVPETFESNIAVDSRHSLSSALASYRDHVSPPVSPHSRLQREYVRCLSAFNLLTMTSAG